MSVQLNITTLGDKFKDYRDGIVGDSYNWGPVINANDIKYFTFHHSVTIQTANRDGNWKAECDSIARLHLARGWAGIGYRFVICSDGTVAYVGDLARGGSAVTDMNNVMFSACMVGDFTKELPTAYQINSAHKLADWFLTKMPQYPNLNGWEDVKGHQDFNPTACPGTHWNEESGIRDRIVKDLWQGYPSPTPTQPVPTPTTEPPIDWKTRYDSLLVTYTELSRQYDILEEEATGDHNKLVTVKNIVWGKSWPWKKITNLKLLLPKT